MKYILFLSILFSFSTTFAQEARVKMLESPDSEKEMDKLMQKVSESCNSRNFKEFMSCFTQKRGTAIRKTMKELFIKHELEMKILSVEPIKEDKNLKEFKLKYSWDSDISPQKQIITSTVVAKKEREFWRIDNETIEDVESVEKENANLELNFGGAGQVAFDENDDFLPRDIAKRPGGCANGRCNIR